MKKKRNSIQWANFGVKAFPWREKEKNRNWNNK
jgi:hypothetical protein